VRAVGGDHAVLVSLSLASGADKLDTEVVIGRNCAAEQRAGAAGGGDGGSAHAAISRIDVGIVGTAQVTRFCQQP
jgi:hypothetical protein